MTWCYVLQIIRMCFSWSSSGVHYDQEGIMLWRWRSLTYNKCVALFLIHNNWEQVNNSPTFLGYRTLTTRSRRVFLSTSRYLALVSSRFYNCCTLHFLVLLRPSRHHHGRWYLSSSSSRLLSCCGSIRSPWCVIGPRWYRNSVSFGQLLVVGRLTPVFQ
jgi:hypothetical protein